MPPPFPIRANALKQLLSRSPLTPKSSPSLRILALHPTTRLFSSTPLPQKKKDRKDYSDNTKSSKKKDATPEPTSTIADDPFDLSTLEAGIEKATTKLHADLSLLRTGGRFNPEKLESVRVVVDKEGGRSERLGDLAQVLPKGGRSLNILVGEAEHVKPVTSAIQNSDLNLQPQQDPHNPLQLTVPIPPPTKESRDAALAAATKTGGSADLGIKNSRAQMQKKLRAMELRKSVRPDDLKKAHKDMEKVVENGHAEVKKIVEAARKAMEQS